VSGEAIWAIVPTRMGSSRLPGKALAELAGRPSLRHILERLSRVPRIDGVVVATTEDGADDVIRDCAVAAGVPCYRGSADDVLDRTLQAAWMVEADTIVTVNGDSPLCDAQVVARVIERFEAKRPDYASNRLGRHRYPVGLDVEVFPTRLLGEIDPVATSPRDREHVTVHVYEHPERYRLLNVEPEPRHERSELRVTLDTEEDLALIRAIYEALYPVDPAFGLDDVLDLLDREPALAGLNAGIVQRVP
jgi:spore coat polysaccharide biosynthesis protein SpsF